MNEKIKDRIKKDYKYFITTICLMFITLLISTILFKNSDFTLKLPFKTLYGTIAYTIIIVLGVYGYFLFRDVDIKSVRLEKVYLFIVIPLGILYCLVNPIGRVPDEGTHIRKAMAIAQGNWFSKPDENGDAKDTFNKDLIDFVTPSNDNYEKYLNKFKKENSEKQVEKTYNTMAVYFPICHLPQAIGITIAKIFTRNVVIWSYMARITNFALVVFLIYESIKIIPFKKYLVLFVALLPISMNEIVSLSSDALTIGISIFYVSFILYLKYDLNKASITLKDIAVLVLSSFVVSVCKIVYLPLCLLLFLIPKEKFGSLKKKNIITISIFLFVFVFNTIWICYSMNYSLAYNSGVNNKDQIIYILKNPLSYLLIVFRTIVYLSNGYITGLCGADISMLNVSCSSLFIYSCIPFITLLFLNNEGKEVKFDKITLFSFFTIFLIIVLLIYTSLYIQWTPVRNSVIDGVQARYFIPILLLTCVFIHNNIFKIKIYNRYILIYLLFLNINAITCIMHCYF